MLLDISKEQLGIPKFQNTILIMAMCEDKYCIFIVMVIINVLNAWFYTCFGPLIPYYSAATGLDQTDYSYLFLIKTVATVFGGWFAKWLLKKISTQKLIIICMVIAMISLCASTFSLSTINLGITMFVATCATVGPGLIGFNVTLKLFLDDEPQYWVQMLQFFFVVGSLLGQFVVAFFKINSLLVLGVAFIIPIIGVLIWPLPHLYGNNATGQLQHQEEKGLQLSTRSIVFICVVFFCFATVEMGIGSWMPTYAIKAGITNTEGSTLYSMLFWIPNCAFRLFWIYLPGAIQKKLGIGLNLGLIATIISVFLQLSGQLQMACYFAPISIGIFISGVYGYCLSWVVNNGFPFNPETSSTFIICYVVGQAIFIMPMGYTMAILGYQSMIIEVFFFALIAVIAFILAVGSMEQDKHEYQMLLQEDKKVEEVA